jgi:hypothetical protein
VIGPNLKPRDVDGRQAHVEMQVELLLTTGLAMAKARKVLGISEEQLNLETQPIKVNYLPGRLRAVGRSQHHVGIAGRVDEQDHADVPFEVWTVQALGSPAQTVGNLLEVEVDAAVIARFGLGQAGRGLRRVEGEGLAAFGSDQGQHRHLQPPPVAALAGRPEAIQAARTLRFHGLKRPMPTKTTKEQERWGELAADPALQDLPYRVETNARGQLILSPRSNRHSRLQKALLNRLDRHAPEGESSPAYALATSQGV